MPPNRDKSPGETEAIIHELQHIRVGMLDHYQAATILEKLVMKAQQVPSPERPESESPKPTFSKAAKERALDLIKPAAETIKSASGGDGPSVAEHLGMWDEEAAREKAAIEADDLRRAESSAAKRTMTIALTDAEMVAMEQMIAQTAMQPRTIFRHALASYQLKLHEAIHGPVRDDRLPVFPSPENIPQQSARGREGEAAAIIYERLVRNFAFVPSSLFGPNEPTADQRRYDMFRNIAREIEARLVARLPDSPSTAQDDDKSLRLQEAVEALEPFAEIALHLEKLSDDVTVDCDIIWATAFGTDGILWEQTVGDFRRAATTLARLEGE